MKDIDNSEEFLYIAFDPELTQMVMNNDDSEQPIPMSIVSVDYEDMDDQLYSTHELVHTHL